MINYKQKNQQPAKNYYLPKSPVQTMHALSLLPPNILLTTDTACNISAISNMLLTKNYYLPKYCTDNTCIVSAIA
jgi:hypothetical protein